MSNTPDTYLGLIALNRSVNIEVINNYGQKTTLDPYVITWVDLTNPVNVKALNNHTSIHQFVSVGEWNNFDCGNYPPYIDLSSKPLSPPNIYQITTAGAGGTLEADTEYFYVVTAVDGNNDETVISNVESVVTSDNGENNHSNIVYWDSTGAGTENGYNIYRNTTNDFNGPDAVFVAYVGFEGLTNYGNYFVDQGEYEPIADIYPPSTNQALGGNWWVAVRSLNRSVKIRVKGWQANDEDVSSYGYHDLKTDRATWIYIGYTPYNADYDSTRNLEDENDWKYNLDQLGRSSAVGQYIVYVWDDPQFIRIQSLNRSSKLRFFDSGFSIQREVSTKVEASVPPEFDSVITNVTGGTLTDETNYYYAIAAKTQIGSEIFESNYYQTGINTGLHSTGYESHTIQFQNVSGGKFTLTYTDIEYNGQTKTFTIGSLSSGTDLAYNITSANLISKINAAFNTTFETTGLEFVTGGDDMGDPNSDAGIIYTLNYDGVLNHVNIDQVTLNDNFTGGSVGHVRSVHVNTVDEPVPTNTNSVTLTWTPSTESNIIGYKIWRSIDGNFDNITSDEYLIADIDNPTVGTYTDDGDSITSSIPNPWWWTGLVNINLNDKKTVKALNSHDSIGQYIVWPRGFDRG
jgi:hypothetical protein